MSFIDSLPTLDLGKLKTVFPEQEISAQSRNGKTALPADLSFRRRVKRRVTVDARRAENALAVIEKLPKRDESLTIVLSGMSDGWDYIAAVVKLLEPKRVESLTLTTLGFNERVIAGVCDFLDRGRVGALAMITSVYFQSLDAKLYDQLHAELTRRGQKLKAVRNHAKLALFAVVDGRRFVLESSANLRSCRNTEVMTLSQDAGLYKFHQGWIADMMRGK